MAATADTTNPPPSACPVDHTTRAAWLEKARQQKEATQTASPPSPSSPSLTSQASPLPTANGQSCDSSQLDQTPPPPPSSSAPSGFRFPSIPFFGSRSNASSSSTDALATDREISTIPRALEPSEHHVGQAGPPSPANNEQETGADKTSGNWIYPSEQMFFNAMRRKNFDARTEDMKAIVPIHNAVNERAWKEIKEWERGRGADACGGPRLASFSGLSKDLTPKARLNALLGYQTPFDRHDWVVDRCGTKVEYVIDFYAGKDEGKAGKSLNFYLDVRPKLNSFEGWRMRAGRLVGL
ncbi:MAG: hypothetical protein M1819_006556 [Sarea resinae]|nr:MAG: hypothetical protein M1819_006556 [Sarea resinae]